MGDNNDAFVNTTTDNILLTHEISQKKDALIGNSQESNIYVPDSIKHNPFHLSNIVEGNDVLLNDVLNASTKTCNRESINNANNNPGLEFNLQGITQSQASTLHFECDDESFITPRLKKYSQNNVESRKRKHREEGFSIHNL